MSFFVFFWFKYSKNIKFFKFGVHSDKNAKSTFRLIALIFYTPCSVSMLPQHKQMNDNLNLPCLINKKIFFDIFFGL